MSEEGDSWFKAAFGVDLGQSLSTISDGASTAFSQATGAVTQVVQGVQGVVEGAIDGVTGTAAAVVKKAAGVVSPPAAPGSSGGRSGSGTGSFPLGGSVGRGGKNSPNDVRAVQSALGIGADGQCGAQTIAAIEAFQRNAGQAKPDGRVDAGGPTERVLAGGGGGSGPSANTAKGEASGSLFDQAVQGAKDLGGRALQEGKDLAGKAEGFGEEVKSGAARLASGALASADGGDPADPGSGGTATADADAGALAGIDRAKLAADVVAKAPGNSGLIGELNNLEDFTKTDPEPVPDDTSTFVGVSPAALASQIKDKEFAIAQLEKTRTNLCVKTRSDARLLEKNLVSSMTQALSGTGALSLGAIVASSGGFIAAGGSLALLTTMVIAIAAEHELYRTYRDNLRLMVDKAKLDLTILNTNIAVEKKRLDSMKRAAGQPIGDEVVVKPFVRPAAPPSADDEEGTPEND